MELRLDPTSYDLIKKAAALLRLKTSNFVRLAITQALMILPSTACLTATAHARFLLLTKLERIFKKPAADLDFHKPDVLKAIREASISDEELSDSRKALTTYIAIGRPDDGKTWNFGKIGLPLSPGEHKAVEDALNPDLPAGDRQIAKSEFSDALVKRVKQEFEIWKNEFSKIPSLRERALKYYKQTEIEPFKNDPQMLDFLIQAKEIKWSEIPAPPVSLLSPSGSPFQTTGKEIRIENKTPGKKR